MSEQEYVSYALPYDKGTVTAKIPKKNFAGELESKAAKFHNPISESETVEKSMDNPIGSPKLEELAKGKKNIVLISSDHTRPVPSHIITPIFKENSVRCTGGKDSYPGCDRVPPSVYTRRTREQVWCRDCQS